MSSVQSGDSKLIAVLCGDIHLSSKPPLYRSTEKDWYETQKGYLEQLQQLSYQSVKENYLGTVWDSSRKVPIFCAGDVFDRWNSSAELINFALKYLPHMYAVPGQHDLPHHSYADIRKSAYWTLVEAKKITNVEGVHDLLGIKIHGFPWGKKVSTPKEYCALQLDIALIHRYVWIPNHGYPGAEFTGRIDSMNWQEDLIGYDVAVFGDNHIPFDAKAKKCVVYNCGGFMIRKSDDKHKPSVGLLYSDGTVKRHYLDISKDSYLQKEKAKEIAGSIGLESFLEELTSLGDSALNFAESINRILERKKVSEEVKKLILSAMEVRK